MSLKVKAKEREMKVGLYAGTYRYVMVPEIYSSLAQEKVIREAALRSGVSQGVMQACWDAAGSVIKAWATEGHSVALPGLGTMRFGLSAKSVADVNDVKTSLIKTRRIVFTPSTDLKDELRNTSVIITCYDRNGQEVKRVTSADDGTVEEPENTDSTVDEGENGTSQSGGGSSQSGSGTGTVTPSNGGGSDSGSQTSGGTSGDGGSGGGDDGFSFG
ncbi:MAG: DNA-binding protein [Prevotella sp.]|nr:DNA-binding protein [Prevotella sp.]